MRFTRKSRQISTPKQIQFVSQARYLMLPFVLFPTKGINSVSVNKQTNKRIISPVEGFLTMFSFSRANISGFSKNSLTSCNIIHTIIIYNMLFDHFRDTIFFSLTNNHMKFKKPINIAKFSVLSQKLESSQKWNLELSPSQIIDIRDKDQAHPSRVDGIYLNWCNSEHSRAFQVVSGI